MTVDSLTGHSEATASTLNYLLLALVRASGETLAHAASHLGVAQSLAVLLRGLPYHASRGRLVIPAEITARHGVRQDEVFRRGPETDKLKDAVFELATVANDHLVTAREMFKETDGKVPSEAMPIFAAGVGELGLIDFVKRDELTDGGGVCANRRCQWGCICTDWKGLTLTRTRGGCKGESGNCRFGC
jgi:NADH dehydrogenase [ubiquinone] 1 alpha subcomplex assembly factor 6